MWKLIEKLIATTKYCPREKWGYKCRRDNPKYNYYCAECGRYGAGHDPEIVERKGKD